MRPRVAVAIVIVAAALAYAFRLGEPSWQRGAGPPRYLFDESYTAFTAHRVLLGDDAVFVPAARRVAYLPDRGDLSPRSRGEWSHPPGAALAVAATMAVLGFTELGARLAALIAALIALGATAALAGRRDAWLACVLVGFDGAFFVFARIAMPHMFLVAGLTAGAALLVAASRGRPWRYACAAGAAFGFAAAVRWTAIPIAVALGAGALISRDGARLARPLVAAIGVAAATYLATYLPWLAHGHGLGELIALHREMLAFHHHIPAALGASPPWFAWPFTRRPVLFVAGLDGDHVRAVLCLGGRVLWWGLVPALVVGAWRARGRAIGAVLPPCAIAATWLPWAVIGRFGLPYYLLPALPFAAIVLAGIVPRRLRLATAAVVLVGFTAGYATLAARPISRAAFAAAVR